MLLTCVTVDGFPFWQFDVSPPTRPTLNACQRWIAGSVAPFDVPCRHRSCPASEVRHSPNHVELLAGTGRHVGAGRIRYTRWRCFGVSREANGFRPP